MKNILYYSFVGLAFILSLLVGLTGHSLFGSRQLLVLESTSMLPSISPGSLIFIQKEPWYQAGDIITFWANLTGAPQLVTHRVVALGGNVYVTKGDNNPVDDRAIAIPRLVIGRTLLVIPLLGSLINYLQTKIGLALLMVPLSFIVYHELRNIKKAVLQYKQ